MLLSEETRDVGGSRIRLLSRSYSSWLADRSKYYVWAASGGES